MNYSFHVGELMILLETFEMFTTETETNVVPRSVTPIITMGAHTALNASH